MVKTFEKRICKICSNEFLPHHHNQEYCQNPHPFKCLICGKEEFKEARKLFHQLGKAICKNPDCLKERTKQTYLEKYGVEHHTKVKNFKVTPPKNEYFTCSGCGETLKKETPFQKNCKKEITITKKCEYCNKDFTYIKLCGVVVKKIPKACSKKCSRLLAAKKSKETFLERYGVDNISKTKEFKDFMREETFFKTDEFKEKMKKDNLDKYGVKYHTQAEEIKEKIKETCIEKYGTTTFLKSEDYKEQRKNRPLTEAEKRYKEELRNRGKTLESVKKYNPWIKHPEEYFDFENYIKSISGKKTVYELAEYFNVNTVTIKWKAEQSNVTKDIKDFNKGSIIEEEFKSKLESNNINYIYRDRTQIKPLELDFFLSEYNIAIELSPTWTHSFANERNGLRTNIDYHYNKFKLCENKGIKLITIFDWIEIDKTIDYIKSIIKKKSNINKFEINITSEFTNKHKKFLNNYFILNSNYNEDMKIVEVIKNKKIIALSLISNNNNEIELKLLVSKPDFKTDDFIKEIIKSIFNFYPNINNIIVYSNNNFESGDIYKNNNFDLIEENQGNIIWSNPQKNKYIKHPLLEKESLDSLLIDYPNYKPLNRNLTLQEKEEKMKKYGFFPVIDCGYRKWLYKTKK